MGWDFLIAALFFVLASVSHAVTPPGLTGVLQRGLVLPGLSEPESTVDEGWVCKIDPETGTCGEVDMSNLPSTMMAMAHKLFGVKQGRCSKYGYCRFLRREDADCGPLLGMRESLIYERWRPSWMAISGPMQRQQIFRTLISRSLQRIISAADVFPGRTIVL
jgi:hypothetical protein